MRYYEDICHLDGDAFIMASTLAQKRDLGTRETRDCEGTGRAGGGSRRASERKAARDLNNKEPAGGKDVECEGRSKLVLR